MKSVKTDWNLAFSISTFWLTFPHYRWHNSAAISAMEIVN